MADGHAEDAVSEQRVLLAQVVLDEVGRAQHRRRQPALLDHALDGVLAGEVRDVGVFGGLEHRQINDALDAGLAGEVEGLQGLGYFVGGVGHQQEQGADAGQGLAGGVEVGQVALDGGDAGGETGLFGRAGQGADFDALPVQLGQDLGTDDAGASGDEYRHG